MKHRMPSPRTAFAFVAPLVAALAGCGSSSSGSPGQAAAEPLDPSSTAIRDVHAALYSADYDSIGKVMAELNDVVTNSPDDRDAVLFSALVRMWKVGEAKRDPNFGVAAQAPVALEALDLFKKARDMNPDDARIPSWIGFMETRIGEAAGSQSVIDQGKADLDAATQNFATFTHFVRGIALLDRAHDDPVLATAPDDIWSVLEACGFTVDRANPDFAYPTKPLAPPAQICRDTTIARHNWKGFFLHAGDIFTKAGDAKTATAMWQNAKKSPTFDKWPFAADVEDRIAHADERAALLTDDDPSNDPELFVQGEHVCVGCHAN